MKDLYEGALQRSSMKELYEGALCRSSNTGSLTILRIEPGGGDDRQINSDGWNPAGGVTNPEAGLILVFDSPGLSPFSDPDLWSV